MGQAVGVAVGDNPCSPTACTTHSVDLNFSDQGVGSSGYWSLGPLNSSTIVTVPSDGTESAYGFYLPSILVAGNLVLDVKTGDSSTDTYSFGIFNSSGAIVAHTSAQSFATGMIYVVPFAEPQLPIAFPPGKYYFGYTGTGSGGGSLTLVPFQAFLTPMAKAQVLTGTGGVLTPFTPPANAWASSATGAAAFAIAP
jgi:hypothetical protein